MENVIKTLQKGVYLGLNTLEQEQYIANTIKEVLKQNQNGITISEITSGTPFSRPTVLKHLEKLVAKREGYKIKRGNVFIYYPNGKAVYPEKQTIMPIDDKRAFKGTILNNNYGRFMFIELKEPEDINGGGFLIKDSDFSTFVEFINKFKEDFDNGRK